MAFKISIVIPVYNAEKHIKDSINSLKKQTIAFNNLEVIMVDDCSRDKSPKIIEGYANKYDNCIAIHLDENSGAAGKPRNVGIGSSTADYVMFLDPDDSYKKNACEVLYNKILETNVDIVSGTYTKIIESSRRKKIQNYGKFRKLEEYRVNSIDENPDMFVINPSLWTKIFKKDLITKNNIKFPIGIPGQDTVFIVESLLCAEGIIFLPQVPIANYMVRDDQKSMTNNITVNYFRGVTESRKLIHEIFKKYNRMEYFEGFIKRSVTFYLKKILASNFESTTELQMAIDYLSFIFEKGEEYNVEVSGVERQLIYNLIKANDLDNVLLYKNVVQRYNRKLDKIESDFSIKSENLAYLQTVRGWFKYKTKNILFRINGWLGRKLE